MYLKRIEIQGFKTFVARATLELSPGITAIVGPNGSGKSNVADALRWVLGEQSMRNLRGRTSQDVIWSGTSGRAAVGMAEVHITLDNSDGWLSTPFAEVTVSRRALRSGDTDYLINRSRVRLRDVTDLLGKGSDKGESYGVSTDRAVLGQGAVDALLALRPSERVAVFEDAAGVRPYFQQRDDALGRLQTTRANLVRLEDIVAEIGPRLPGLKRASERARRFLDIQRECANLAAKWYRLQWVVVCEQLRKTEGARDAAALHASETLRSYEDLQVRIAARTSAYQSAEGEARRLHKSLQECQASAKEAAHLSAVLHERRTAAHAEQTSLVGQQVDVEARRLAIESERNVLADRLEISRAELSAIPTGNAGGRTPLDEAQRRLSNAERQSGQLRNQMTSLQGASEKRKAEASGAHRRLEDCTAQLERARSEERRRRERLGEFVTVIVDIEERLRVSEAIANRADAERTALTTQIVETRGRIEQERAQMQTVQRQQIQFAARRDALLDLQRNLADTSTGTQAVWKRRAEIPGLFRLVATGFDVPSGTERAFQAVLGPAFEAFIVETESAAKGVRIAMKHRHAAAFFAASSATPRVCRLPDALLNQIRTAAGDGWVGMAVETFAIREPQLRHVHQLLAHWVLVRDVPAACAVQTVLSADGAHLVHVATLDGCSISQSGLWNFGVAESTSKLVDRDREITRLTKSLEECEHVLGVAGTRLAHVEDVLHRLTAARTVQEKVSREARDDELKARSVLTKAQREYDQLVGEQRSAARVQQQMQLQLEDLHRTMETLASGLPEEEQQLQAIQSAWREAVTHSEQCRKDVATCQQSWQAIQMQTALLQQRITAEGQALYHLDESVRALHNENTRLSERARRVGGQIEELEAATHQHETKARHELEHVHDLERRWAAADATALALNRQLENERAAEAVLRQEWTSAVQQDQGAARVHEQSQLRHGVLENQIQQELSMDPATLASLPDDGMPEEQLRTKRDALKQSLKQLGQVNPDAADEYAAIAERHTYLNVQIQDVRKATDELVAVVGELNCRIEQQFGAVFTRTAESFTRYFGLLFPGGDAQLLLQRGDDRTPAVDVTVRLPGKKQQDLALLSGGERSLVAVALLFAMIDARPTPFCLLDEADAALDEANVERFCSLLRGLARKTQFIVITHNRATMLAAKSLFGVSMGPDGTSRLVSWKLGSGDVADDLDIRPPLD